VPVFNYTGNPGTLGWEITRGDEETLILAHADLAADSYTITRVVGVEQVTINSAYDLTGKTFAAAVSVSRGSTVLVTPTCSHNDTGGELTITISQADSESLPAGFYVWELVETTSGAPSEILSGRFTVKEGVAAR
jgi:hypothetical protein